MRSRERVGYGLIGVGIGGLVDGFVLHQLLQWHHLWSRRTDDRTVEGLEENTFADGVFHLAILAVLVLGIALLAGRRVEGRPLAGLVLVGWGAFHLVDQAVFHLALGAHHIRMHVENPEAYDWGFTAIGAAFIALGVVLARRPVRLPAVSYAESARSSTGARVVSTEHVEHCSARSNAGRK